jgi:hypothetical protein
MYTHADTGLCKRGSVLWLSKPSGEEMPASCVVP